MKDVEFSFGMKVKKRNTSKAMKWLKSLNLLHPNLKISHEENFSILPLKEELGSIKTPFEFSLIEKKFDTKIKRQSLKERLLQLNPLINPEILQSSYDQIGDIAIIDLKEPLIEFKLDVAQAILDSNSSVKTVYRKSSRVDGVYRIRELDFLRGEKKSITMHKEYGLKIILDVKKAYFSPRLSTEHNRIAKKISQNTKVLDLFGGVAPFGLHITKSLDVVVDSIDINSSIPVLVEQSILSNKLVGKLNVVCSDAHNFIKSKIQEKITYDYIIMNHPSGSHKYLRDAIQVAGVNCTIFYYRFVPIENYLQFSEHHIKSFNQTIVISNVHIVRQYSPEDYHVCIELLKKSPDQIAHH